jgi:hypothetical protein
VSCDAFGRCLTCGRQVVTFGCLVCLARFLVVGFVLLAGCPKPGPSPVYPPDADASPPVMHVSCDVACQHVSKIPGAASFATCLDNCLPVQSLRFADCLNGAKTKADVTGCDH